MTNRLLANLGFLLQISCLLTIYPISLALFYNETQAAISLFLACVAFLGSGFLSNALCEKQKRSWILRGQTSFFWQRLLCCP